MLNPRRDHVELFPSRACMKTSTACESGALYSRAANQLVHIWNESAEAMDKHLVRKNSIFALNFLERKTALERYKKIKILAQ